MRRPHHRADLDGHRRHRRDGHGNHRPPRRRRHPRRDHRRSGSYHRRHRRGAHPDQSRGAARHRAGAHRGDRAHRGGRRGDVAACCRVWLHRGGDRRRDAAAYRRGRAGHRPDPAAWVPAAPPAAPRRTDCCRPAGVEGVRAWVPPGLAWGPVPRRAGRVPEWPPGAPGRGRGGVGTGAAGGAGAAGFAAGGAVTATAPSPDPAAGFSGAGAGAFTGALAGPSRGLWSRRTPPAVDARPGLPLSTTPI